MGVYPGLGGGRLPRFGRWAFTPVWEVGVYPGLGGGRLPRFGRWAFTPVWEVGVYPGLGGGCLPRFGRWAFTPVWEVGVYPVVVFQKHHGKCPPYTELRGPMSYERLFPCHAKGPMSYECLFPCHTKGPMSYERAHVIRMLVRYDATKFETLQKNVERKVSPSAAALSENWTESCASHTGSRISVSLHVYTVSCTQKKLEKVHARFAAGGRLHRYTCTCAGTFLKNWGWVFTPRWAFTPYFTIPVHILVIQFSLVYC